MNRELLENTTENEFMKRKLFALISLLNSLDTKHAYEVKYEYLDFGADIKWMCINCLEFDTGNSYQAITPRDWDDIYAIKDDSTLFKQLSEIAERIYFQANVQKLTEDEVKEAYDNGTIVIYAERDEFKNKIVYAVCKDIKFPIGKVDDVVSAGKLDTNNIVNRIMFELYHTYRAIKDIDKQKLYEYVTDNNKYRK